MLALQGIMGVAGRSGSSERKDGDGRKEWGNWCAFLGSVVSRRQSGDCTSAGRECGGSCPLDVRVIIRLVFHPCVCAFGRAGVPGFTRSFGQGCVCSCSQVFVHSCVDLLTPVVVQSFALMFTWALGWLLVRSLVYMMNHSVVHSGGRALRLDFFF